MTKHPPPGSNTTLPAGSWSSWTVRLAARALPAGAARDRYRQEFLADLHGLSRSDQLRHALWVLVRSHALRSAVATGAPTSTEATMTVRTSRKPIRCRTNVHHTWAQEWTTDGQRFVRCARCGKDRTEYDDGNFDGKIVGSALGQLGGASGGAGGGFG